MGQEKPECSQLLVDEAAYGEEFRSLLDALFCACLPDLDGGEKALRRDLFRMVDMEGFDLSKAGQALGISTEEARKLQEKTRREIAILLVLGLGATGEAAPRSSSTSTGCRCGHDPEKSA